VRMLSFVACTSEPWEAVQARRPKELACALSSRMSVRIASSAMAQRITRGYLS
jgi:hypothetical protein